MTGWLEILVELLTFGLVVLVAITLARLIERFGNVRRRLADETPVRVRSASPLIQKESVRNPFLVWVQSTTSIKDNKDRMQLRRELALAGFENPAAPIWYVIARFTLAIALPLGFILMQQFSQKPQVGLGLIIWSLLLCCVGLIGPRSFVDNRIRARAEQVEFEFPDTLDLLVVCVEAGLGLEAALVRVGKETASSHPRVAFELGRVSQELAAGRSRPDALRAMAERTGVDSVKAFVALIIQTDALGTSIAQTLRTFAVEMRQTRYLKAEEKALRIPVLMTVPLVACILPVVTAALLLPPAIEVVRQVLPALSHHH